MASDNPAEHHYTDVVTDQKLVTLSEVTLVDDDQV